MRNRITSDSVADTDADTRADTDTDTGADTDVDSDSDGDADLNGWASVSPCGTAGIGTDGGGSGDSFGLSGCTCVWFDHCSRVRSRDGLMVQVLLHGGT